MSIYPPALFIDPSDHLVLTQLSSCSVEHLFSRLKCIQDVCGGRMYEDMLEISLFIQCNGDVHEIMNDIEKHDVYN